MIKDYAGVVAKVKDVWSSIVDKFHNTPVLEEQVGDYAENFKLGERATKHLKKRMALRTGETNLWQFCLMVFDYISQRNYKTDVHKTKRLDRFCKLMFDYALTLDI